MKVCDGHGEWSHGELFLNFGRCTECGETAPDPQVFWATERSAEVREKFALRFGPDEQIAVEQRVLLALNIESR
jgi:hypothetical protein